MTHVFKDLLHVAVAPDKMWAELTVLTDDPELFFQPEEVKHFLREQGVAYGIDETALAAVCQRPAQHAGAPLRIAAGKPAVKGENGRVEMVFVNREDKGPKDLGDGRVDYRTVTEIANVSKGQLIARKVPPQAGEPGIGVDGETIPAQAGKDAVIKLGKNVVADQERTLVYAAIDGQVSIAEDGKINVFPVYEVNGDVDFGIGNIDFVGTVVIRGNVLTGFHIKASGDIRVYGSVEGAVLEAGGSVEIKNGIVAQDKGHVTAGQDVKASYIQNAHVTARGNVLVSQSIMFSQVRAGESVICQGTKGIIIGGTIQAGGKIVARVIGNSSATPTVLEVGVKPELRQEWNQLVRELQVAYENLRKTDQGLNVLTQLLQVHGELPSEKKLLQIKLMNNRLGLEKEIKRLEEQKQEVEAALEGDSPAVVEVSQLMYPGIKLVFGKLVRFIKQEHSRTRFQVLDGEIVGTQII